MDRISELDGSIRLIEEHFQLYRPHIDVYEDIDHEFDYGCSSLMVAILLRDERLARELLAEGADTRTQNQYHQTVLHFACATGIILKDLLNTDAVLDLNATDDFNQTPLIVAARCNSFRTVRRLIPLSPDVRHKTVTRRYTALHWAVLSGDVNIVQAITLVDQFPAHLDSVGYEGYPPLLDAVRSGRVEVLAALLKAGCNIHVCDRKGNSALHLAHDAPTARLLLQAGLDVDSAGPNGRTPLMQKTIEGNIPLMAFLTRKKADLTRQDDDGWTVLHYALTQSATKQTATLDLLMFLVKHGADPFALDCCKCYCSEKKGCSPTLFAHQSGSLKIWLDALLALGFKGYNYTERDIIRFQHFEKSNRRHICCQACLRVPPEPTPTLTGPSRVIGEVDDDSAFDITSPRMVVV
ncbi:ankyrin [Patellaria atrata CBS 101060]|uniref:Ankyrin n=1 Tax=Patellaria atrata CBS 101060 TaxID=1346257 RepID=A0A9P4SBM2_9PEZI|nr:ankyrin [Patellaria atrata CBS 101060]